MKRAFWVLSIILGLLVIVPEKSYAQAAFIKAAITKAIKALDLQVQRLQTKTIWFQNIQKVAENTMSQLKLTAITDWVQRQKDLYGNYYQELWKVKDVIRFYSEVEDIIHQQVLLVKSYRHYHTLFRRDKHFTALEMNYFEQVYSGILGESVKNLNRLYLVINPFATQMSDGERLRLIHEISGSIEQNYTDLQTFNNQNIRISLQRAKEQNDIDVLRRLYGLQ